MIDLSCIKDFWAIIPKGIILLIFATRSKETWLKFDAVCGAVHYVALTLFTEYFLGNVIDGKLDGIHLSSFRAFAFWVGCLSLFYYVSRKSKDPTVHTSLMFARIVGLVFVVINEVYCHQTFSSRSSRKLSDFHYKNVLPFHVLWLLASLYQALRIEDWGGYAEMNNRVTVHQRLDFLFLFLNGVIIYALPDWHIIQDAYIEKPDAMHMWCVRMAGAFMIANAILVGRSTNFLATEDKKAIFISRIVSLIIGLFPMYYAAWTYYLTIKSSWAIKSTITIGLIIVNSALGLLSAKNK